MLAQREKVIHGLEDGSLTSPEPSKDKVLWFQYKVCQEQHPWTDKQNDPQKRIAALELYGTLFLALLLMAQNPSTSCRLHIPLLSDNQGNVYSILNNATRKMPTAVILMELPIHVEMTTNGPMSWRILNREALILLWEWILRPISINLLWIQKFGKLAILHCARTPWIPRVGSGSRTRRAPPCSSRSWEGRTRSDPFSILNPFLFKQWWSGPGGRVGHKGSPLHTALVGTVLTSLTWGAP